ncbi:MAG: electron transport complex subunit RsxC [Clostridia bacterium]|nr:electron transport complex subunit RsxC [Clostridia bacterium]
MKIKGKYFSRGVKVPGNKTRTEDLQIETLEPKSKVYISLSQHIGKLATSIVEAGQEVKCGQLIAQADGFVSANIYSSVSGKVLGIEKKKLHSGIEGDFIVIENDFKYDEVFLDKLDNPEPKDIIARIREAGIVGMGGAGFPTDVKLSPKDPVDTLVINGAECEPYLTCDYRLMVEKSEEVHKGIQYIAKALGIKNIYIGIELNKPQAIEIFDKFDDLTVVMLKKQYPMGSEKHLIYCCTGRVVGTGKLPASAGCVVQNIATAYAIYDAIENGRPLYRRVMTVSGLGVDEPKNLLVRNGMPFSEIREYCKENDNAKMMISGGPMMGMALSDDEYYTAKTSSGLLLLTEKEFNVDNPSPCINCGRCADACPMHLLPMQIDFYTLSGAYEKAEKLGGVMDCISCGSCAYSCPAKRALVQSITLAKQKIAILRGGRK